MTNSKLIACLMTLEKGEWLRLSQFVRSPYFNKNEEVILLFDLLRSLSPDFTPKTIEKQSIYNRLFPNTPYDGKHMNYLMNFLLKVVEQFLSVEQYLLSPQQSKLGLLEAYLKRNLIKHYDLHQKKVAKNMLGIKEKDIEYYQDRYQLALLAEKKFQGMGKRQKENHIQLLADTLDEYYLRSKLQYSCEMLDRKKAIAIDFDLRIMDELEPHLELIQDFNDSTIGTTFLLYKMLKEENNESHFFSAKSSLEQTKSLFSKPNLKQLYYYLINYCIRRIRTGKNQFMEELLELYTTGIQETILFDNNQLSPWTFKNVVKLGLGTKRYNWTEQFIKQYEDRLPEDFRADALHYNMAHLYFLKNAFDQAIFHLNQVEFSDVYYLLDSKVLLLKIYYEEKEFDPLFALAQSFRILIRRNNLITQDVKAFYLNFIKLLIKLSKLYQKKDIPQLENEIKETDSLTDRQWLLQKVSDWA